MSLRRANIVIDDPKEKNCFANANPIPLEPPDIKTFLFLNIYFLLDNDLMAG